jgi:sigma-B regulation protein RsbU (phosphoserine phosphatase)
MANAGHPAPILLGPQSSGRVEATGMPVGMFCSQQFEVASLQASPGDTLLLCSDGITDCEDPYGLPYGLDRLVAIAASERSRPPADLVLACIDDVTRFRAAAPLGDDLSLLAIRRSV